MTKRILAGLLLAGAIALLMWVFLFGVRQPSQTLAPAGQESQGQGFVGAQERVILVTPQGEVQAIAKIDTGADASSIDSGFARSLGFEPTGQKVTIVTDQGREERDTVEITLFLAGRRISTLASLADRSGLSTPMIIGRGSLTGLIVDPSREFLTEPRQQPGSGVATVFGAGGGMNKVVLIIPLLGFPVVLVRVLGGIRTYGIFAPVVVALSLLDLDLVPGLLVYLYLVSLGIGAKLLVLDRLQLPNVAELAFIVSILVVGLLGLSALPVALPFSVAETFFRLIITTFIIEQASRAVEDRRTREMIPLLIATFAMAIALTVYASFLLRQSFTVLWAIFAVSLVAAALASNYLGLRLNEFFRFKFLKRTHVH